MKVSVLLWAVLAVIAFVEGREINQDKARDGYRKQLNQLKKMKCQPKWTKIIVKEELGDQSELLDNHFTPAAVAVMRCNDSCSFCGGNKRCLPTKTKKKIFYLALSNRKFTYFRAQVHQKCACMDGTTESDASGVPATVTQKPTTPH